MSPRTMITRVLSVDLLLLVALSPASAAATGVDLLPDTAIATLTIRDGAQRVRDLRQAAPFQRYLASPAYEALQSQPQFVKALGGVYFFAGTVGCDAWTLASQSLGRELTLALLPGDQPEKPRIVALLTPDDRSAADRMVEVVLSMTGVKAGGNPASGQTVVDGVTVYKLNDEAFLASLDETIAFCNHEATLKALVGSRAAPAGKLSASAGFRQAKAAAPADAIAWSYVNIRALRDTAGPAWEKKADNFVGAMLVSGWLENLRRADVAAAWLTADSHAISVGGRTFGGAPDGALMREFSVPVDDQRDWSALEIPGLLATLDLSRNWPGFWELREKLLEPDGIRGAAEFAGIVTTIMGNLDFAGEFLPSLRPTLHFLAARRTFEAMPPAPALPAFAVIFHLKDAQKLRQRLESGALSALSIINVDAGQKMQPQYQLSMEHHGAVKMIVGKYPPNLDPGPPGIRYNFEPSIAVVDDQFVIATSQAMLEQLIDAIAKLPATVGDLEAAGGDRLRANLHELYRVFDANREALIANRMLEKDLDRASAARDVGVFLDAAKLLEKLSVNVRPSMDGLTMSLRLSFSE